MARVDPLEKEVMRDCQRGFRFPNGGSSGSVCRKKEACRLEGRCYFVARMERYLELHNARMPGDYPRITWHPGYDGYEWAI